MEASVTMKPYVPANMPPAGLDQGALLRSLGDARDALGEYRGFLAAISAQVDLDPWVVFRPLATREALDSSRIEGTQVTLHEVFSGEAGQTYKDAQRNEILEVLNYRRAVRTGERYLADNPRVTLYLLKLLHETLLDGVPGTEGIRRGFREKQNHIGRPGSPIEQARFVPPEPLLVVPALEQLEDFMSAGHPATVDPLVKVALAHAQFELIHPFDDGNGRVGRMLVPLLMQHYGLLKSPTLYVSNYLLQHDREYRDRLLAISQEGDWQGWVAFFVEALRYQARASIDKADEIWTLYMDMRQQFNRASNSKYGIDVLDAFFKRPVTSAPRIAADTKIRRQTCRAVLRSLCRAELVREILPGSGRRATLYAFPKLLELTN